jgi:membrane protease YdiL (CAAX protease family)
MLRRPEARIVALFLLAFALHQAGVFVFGLNGSFGWLLSAMYVAIALTAILFIRRGGSQFRQHGFLLPSGVGRYLAMAAFFGFVYVFILIFIPGAMSGFDAFPGVPLSWDTFLTAGSIVLASIASETVFRGYIQTELEADHGFYVALTAVSILFALYMYPIASFWTGNFADLISGLLPFLAESVFLGFFLKETKTLLCPMVFTAAVGLLMVFTPLEALNQDYTLALSIVTFIVLIPVMQSFVADVRHQDERRDDTAVVESEDQKD